MIESQHEAEERKVSSELPLWRPGPVMLADEALNVRSESMLQLQPIEQPNADN